MTHSSRQARAPAKAATQEIEALHSQLHALTHSIRPTELRHFVSRTFGDLTRLLGYLDVVENSLRGGTIEDSLPLFSIIQGEALSMCGFMEAHRSEPYIEAPLANALDSAAFATRHELRRVFERELARTNGDADTDADQRARVADAHEVLRNCFQQATALLAHALDATVSDTSLFGGVQVRREKSMQLCEDLNALLRVMRHVEEDFSPQAVTLFVMRLQDFRLGSMRYLMQKDWAMIENFLVQIPTLHSERKIKTFIHQFSGYLEVLLGHVRMRSVLSS